MVVQPSWLAEDVKSSLSLSGRQVAALGSAASANRLPSYDTHTLNTPEHALGSYFYTTDDEGWPRARVCLVHVPSAVPVPVGFRRSWPIQTAQGHPSVWFFRYH